LDQSILTAWLTSSCWGRSSKTEGWIAVAGLERHFRDTLLAQFPGDGSERARLTAGFRTRRADEWHAWAESVDLPIVAVSEP
jgi:alpha-methylacyl-CoA racemase